MARKITIPIDDDDDQCKSGYIVEYKLDSESNYQRLFPDPLFGPVILENLLDDSNYNIRVKRKCCNGSFSDWTSVTVDTTIE